MAEILGRQPDPLLDPICFHCQQAAEKLLKAVLVAMDQPPPRSHDLEYLCGLCRDPTRLPPDLAEALAFLTPFAVLPRYPVPAGSRAPDRAARARLHVRRLCDWVAAEFGWPALR